MKALDGRASVTVLEIHGDWQPSQYEYCHPVTRASYWAELGITDDRYEVMLVLGDRHEILAACPAATVAKVPIAHIHGGERTLGSYDDRIRDAITSLAKIHFAATRNAHEIILSMARQGDKLYLTGAPGLDAIVDLPERKPTKTFVLTYHPETAGDDKALPELVEALKQFQDYEVIWTGVNNDPGADRVREAFKHYTERKLTPREYILACRQAAVVIGNSSSGIIEAPTIGVPSVNVGTRQKGRESGPSVYHALPDAADIAFKIDRALGYTGSFHNPYYRPGASRAIAERLVAA